MTDKDRAERRRKILETYAQSGSLRQTARTLGYGLNAVRRVLRGADMLKVPTSSGPKRPSKLDPFRAVIERLVLDEQLWTVLVFEELRSLGYEGGETVLKDYVRRLRPSSKLRVTTRLEHPPGEEGQVDWSPYGVTLGGERQVVHAFSMVLPFSRFLVVRFALDEKLETLIALHEEAFGVLGAVPRRMTYDNMTTVGRHVGPGEVQLNAQFEAYAQSRGFDIHILPPARPTLHGAVERPFGYIENNCLARARFRFDSLAHLNVHAAKWCQDVANVRVHGTTRERPVDRLVRERPLMLPLGHIPAEPCRTLARLVRSDFCVTVDTNHYSVPPRCVGQPATVKLYAERLEVLVGGETVAVHELCRAQHQRRVLPEHEEQFLRVTPSRRLLEQAFTRLGPAAEQYYEGLRAQRGHGAGYHLQRILRLADRHGSSVVVGAMAHAARYGNYSASAVGHLIAGRPEALARKATPDDGLQSAPPERVARWLEGLHVEQRNLADYDRMLAGLDGLPAAAPALPSENDLHAGTEQGRFESARAPRGRSDPSPRAHPTATPAVLPHTSADRPSPAPSQES
jgi:transposase